MIGLLAWLWFYFSIQNYMTTIEQIWAEVPHCEFELPVEEWTKECRIPTLDHGTKFEIAPAFCLILGEETSTRVSLLDDADKKCWK